MTLLINSGFNATQLDNPKRFDLLATVEKAAEEGIDGVQLYLNDSVFDIQYSDDLINAIINSQITDVVIHLPNFDHPKLQEFVSSASILTYRLREKGLTVNTLIHFGYGKSTLTEELLPKVASENVYLENSKTGEFDIKHVLNAIRLANSADVGFVFDIGRIAYADIHGNVNPKKYFKFVERVVNLFDNDYSKLIIHTAGKSQWLKYREHACAHGDSQDIFKPLYKLLHDFHLKGGRIVFEAEDEDDVINSIDFFKNL